MGQNLLNMCDTAGTLCKASDALKEAGAKSVRAIVTHGVLSGPAYERIHESSLDEFICSNSLKIRDVVAFPQMYSADKHVATIEFITQISVAKQIKIAIDAINGEGKKSLDKLKHESISWQHSKS